MTTAKGPNEDGALDCIGLAFPEQPKTKVVAAELLKEE